MNLLECLKIAVKYGTELSAEHDVVYFCGPPPSEEACGEDETWTPEMAADVAALEAHNAHFDTSVDSWAKFV